jgi:twitching motility protein PilT
MQTFDQSLYQLYKSGLVTLDEALKRATNPDEFRLKIQGVQFTSDVSREQMEESLQISGEGDLMGGDLQFEIEQSL